MVLTGRSSLQNVETYRVLFQATKNSLDGIRQKTLWVPGLYIVCFDASEVHRMNIHHTNGSKSTVMDYIKMSDASRRHSLWHLRLQEQVFDVLYRSRIKNQDG